MIIQSTLHVSRHCIKFEGLSVFGLIRQGKVVFQVLQELLAQFPFNHPDLLWSSQQPTAPEATLDFLFSPCTQCCSITACILYARSCTIYQGTRFNDQLGPSVFSNKSSFQCVSDDSIPILGSRQQQLSPRWIMWRHFGTLYCNYRRQITSSGLVSSQEINSNEQIYRANISTQMTIFESTNQLNVTIFRAASACNLKLTTTWIHKGDR